MSTPAEELTTANRTDASTGDKAHGRRGLRKQMILSGTFDF